MKYKYRTVNIRQGFGQVKRLKARGWKVSSMGMFTVKLQKPVTVKIIGGN
jgi:hypothetical protein